MRPNTNNKKHTAMSIKQTNILLTVSCYATCYALMPLFSYWSELFDSLWILMLLLLIEFALLLLPAWYSEHHLEKAKLPSEYAVHSEPMLVVGNRFTHRDYAWIVLSDIVWFGFYTMSGYYILDIKMVVSAASLLFAIPFLWSQRRSQRKSTYTLRSDRLLIKEYRFGRMTTDLDIPIDEIEDIRYQYGVNIQLQQWLILTVNGNKLELHTHGCAEQLACEIIARQRGS